MSNQENNANSNQVKIFESICEYLNKKSIVFQTVHHAETYTSEESAKARGVDVSIGGKAILMKVDDAFKLFVISASKKIDSKKIKTKFGSKNIRFATVDELKELTGGLVPGCVPPFGQPILPFQLYIDESITQNDKIAFNAGLLTDSIIMNVQDYLKCEEYEVFKFSS